MRPRKLQYAICANRRAIVRTNTESIKKRCSQGGHDGALIYGNDGVVNVLEQVGVIGQAFLGPLAFTDVSPISLELDGVGLEDGLYGIAEVCEMHAEIFEDPQKQVLLINTPSRGAGEEGAIAGAQAGLPAVVDHCVSNEGIHA